MRLQAQTDFYSCSVPDGEAVGQALAEQLQNRAARKPLTFRHILCMDFYL